MKLNFLLSDDIFISYSRWDGSTYAPGLADKLIQRGFSCFIDRYGTDPNRDLPETLKAKIRSCKMFVLVATERAAASEAVEKEIREFQQTGRASRIVPIDVDGSLKSARWYDLVDGIAPEPEKNTTALDDGDASQSVVNRIEKSFNYTRGKQRLRRATVAALVLLIALLAAGGLASLYARNQLKAATQAKAEADVARSEAEQQKRAAAAAETRASQAGERQRKAEEGLAVAVNDKTTAEKLRDEAKAARDEAARQRIEAEKLRDVARAEAVKQGLIAESGRQATHSQTLLRQRPLQLLHSVSTAIDSMNNAVKARIESIGADSALRDSMALLPRYLGGEKYERGFVYLVLSPDAQHFAALTNTSRLQIFSVANAAKPLAEFSCEGCYEVAVSNGGEFAAVGLEETVRIFDVKAGKNWDLKVKQSSGEFIKLALSPKGKYLAIVYRKMSDEGEGGTILASLIDVRNGNVVKNLSRGLGIRINDVAFSPNGNLAIAGKKSGQNLKAMGGALIWYLAEGGSDWEDRKLEDDSSIKTASHEQEDEIFAVAPGLDDTNFATSTYELTTVWKLGAGGKFEPVAQVPLRDRLLGQESIAGDLAFDSDGVRLAVVRDLTPRDDNRNLEQRRWTQALETWDSRGHWEAARVFEPSEIKQVGFRPSGEVVAVLDKSGSTGASVYQPLGGAEFKSAMQPGEGDAYAIKESADARLVLARAGDVAQLWDLIRGTKIPITLDLELDFPECIAVSADGKFFVAATSKRNKAAGITVSVFSLTGGSYTEARRLPLQNKPSEIAITRDGSEVALLNEDRTVEVLSVKDGRDLTPKPLRGMKALEMRLGPTGKHLATQLTGGTTDRTVQIWSLSEGIEVKSIKHSAWVPVIEFSPGERFLLTASEDYTTHLLDLKSYQLTRMENDANVYAGAFSADEHYYATGSNEGLLKVSLTASPNTEVARVQHKGQVTKIAFSADNRFLATASTFHYPYRVASEESNSLRVFLLRPQDLIDEAAARIQSIFRLVR